MADLFTMTAPLLIRYPDGRRDVMVERFRHPQGLLYFRIGWDRMEVARGMVLVEGAVRGEGPWKVGDAVITVLGCQGSHPDEAGEFADWQMYREQLGSRYPDHAGLRELARRAGYLP